MCYYKTVLFYKMQNELNQREMELLCLSPREILKAAFELTYKREILFLFGESSPDFLSDEVIKQLCGLKYPLDTLYLTWLKEDSSVSDMMRSCVESYCQDRFPAQYSGNQEKYELVEVCGQKALFSNGRISDKDIPDGMYHYDLREGDGRHTNFASIEPYVLVDFAGAIITLRPIDFGTDGFIELDYDTEPNFLCEELTIEEFSHLGGDEDENGN